MSNSSTETEKSLRDKIEELLNYDAKNKVSKRTTAVTAVAMFKEVLEQIRQEQIIDETYASSDVINKLFDIIIERFSN